MRRGMWIAVVLLAILAAVGIGIGAYNWGVTEGLQESGRSVEVVRYHGHGFFPFGFLFPLLFFFFLRNVDHPAPAAQHRRTNIRHA
jgi:hypothetical protein